jgi:hypothetical protein
VSVDEAFVSRRDTRRFLNLDRRDLMQAPPIGKALQLVAPAIIEDHLVDRSDQLAHDLRDEDLTAPRLTGHTGGHVDRGAEDVARFLDDLAGVEPDADPDPSLRVLLAVVGDRLLDRQRALDAMARRPEADHETVAEALDAATGVLRDLLVDDRLVRLHDLVRGGEPPGRQELGRLLDVGEHDRHRAFGLAHRKAADDRLRG